MRYKYFYHPAAFALITAILLSCSAGREKNFIILETTDLHGFILPYNFIEKEDLPASLSHSSTYIKKLRDGQSPVILLDNGDNLQGQPEMYYYNFIDTVSPHFSSEVMNYLDYDAGTIGNHDIEAGHSVYDRLIKEYKFPLLAANAVDIKTGDPYFKPYVIIKKNGIKVAVLGLVTPSIPDWLPPEFYAGMKFGDMVSTAAEWMPVILNENPDLVVGLFHSGWDREDESGSAAVAYNVPGFDIIFTGHDHRLANEKFVNKAGDTILILNGGSNARNLAKAEVTFMAEKKNGRRRKILSGEIVDIKNLSIDPDFIDRFDPQNKIIHNYVDKVIGNSTATMSSRESYFGSSAFVDMIHSVQLEITGADISFAAPLSFDVEISEGPVTVGDMFKLYRYENMLYSMTMTGEEIQKYLEYSYAAWYNTMKGPGHLLLKLRTDSGGKPVLTDGKAWLRNLPYNFDSAAGIDYIVDVSKPEGERIKITSFTGGRPFKKDENYKVAVNSYRGSGGGGHLTMGAGINDKELRSRLITSTERDLRYYLMKSIEKKKAISPGPLNNWKVIPEDWVKAAAEREYVLLFGKSN